MLKRLVAAALLLVPGLAAAQVEITISSARKQAVPVAVTEFRANGAGSAQLATDLPALIAANLNNSGAFAVVDRGRYPVAVPAQPSGPDLVSWQGTNATALATGEVNTLADGRLQVNFYLFDLPNRREYFAQAYSAGPQNWRRIGHIISDEIYKSITGETGLFDSRVAFVSESGPSTRRVKRLAIMDQDGGNHRFLTDGSDLVLTPRFSPTRQELTYLSFVNGRPRVYLLNLETGQREELGDFPGMSFAPSFSPDGNRVAMSLALNGNTDVYIRDLGSRSMAQLTRSPAIDTSPSFSPDGKRIVFNSDRGGSQQLYVMNSDGSDVRRISFAAGNYATPTWSPTGDWIAYTRILKGEFSIGVMKPDGGDERVLATGFLVEGPTWSPNGRMLMYYKQSPSNSGSEAGLTALYRVDLFTFRESRVATPTDASDPSWSPLLPR